MSPTVSFQILTKDSAWDERESNRESVDTLPARRPANYTEGKKTKEGLCGSQVYEVIKDVYTAWNKGGRVDVYELQATFRRRLKRSLDALRKRRSQTDSHLDVSDEPSTEPSSSAIVSVYAPPPR
ncbi:hypothetical protein SprV_0200554100 [Sparganum proliferum]